MCFSCRNQMINAVQSRLLGYVVWRTSHFWSSISKVFETLRNNLTFPAQQAADHPGNSVKSGMTRGAVIYIIACPLERVQELWRHFWVLSWFSHTSKWSNCHRRKGEWWNSCFFLKNRGWIWTFFWFSSLACFKMTHQSGERQQEAALVDHPHNNWHDK